MKATKWVMLALMMIAAAALALTPYNQNYERKIVNGFEVIKGERPAIDLNKVPAEAYEPGKLTIKFKEGYETKSSERFIKPSTKGFVEIGIASVDQVNKSVSAQQYDRKFYSLLEIPGIHSVAKFKDRHEAWGFHRVYEIEIPADQDVIAAVRQYAALPEIEYAEPVYKKKLHEPVEVGPVEYDTNTPVEGEKPEKGSKWTPNDTYFSPNQWHYYNYGQTIGSSVGISNVDVRSLTAWDIEKGNPLFITAIIDQGVAYEHPDIAANMWSGIGWDFGNDDSTIEPGDHGSHVGATVAGVTNNGIGIAGLAGGDGTAGTGSKLMSCQVFGSTNGGFDTAPIWAADHGASISQNSWGYTNAGVYDQAVLDAIDYFNLNGGQDGGLQGGITIFAAGNDGTDDEWYPAYYDGTMAVASHTNQGKKSSFSNYGTWVEITAPGTDVYSCNKSGGYMLMSGTSMACPHVSGAAAMIVANSEGALTATDLRTILMTSVWDIYAYETNTTYANKLGTGALDASAALVLTQEYLGGVPMPKNFASVSNSSTTIDLSWNLNEHNDNVLVAWSSSGGAIGDPVDGTVYSVGETLPDGGTVIFYGADSLFTHSSLSVETGYDYKIWSRAMAERQDSQGEWYQEGTYSDSKSTGATTLMNPIFPSATSMGFENAGSIPAGWTQDGNWTFVTSATVPTAPAEGSYFAHYNFDTGTTSKLITPRFDMTGYTGISLNFQYVITKTGNGAMARYDNLKIYYRTSSTSSWNLLQTYERQAYTTWQSASIALDDGILTSDFYIAFEGLDNGANGVSVDDVVVNGTSSGTAPAAPTLVSPTDTSTLYILTPTFDWSDVADATSYNILVDNNSDFSSPEINQSPAVSNYTPATDMALGTYYWKVLSTNAYGSSAYSTTWSVVIAPLNAPINVVTSIVGTDLTVSWDAVTGADSYDVYSSEDPYGTFTLVTNVTTNSYVTTPSGAKLFWYVIAKN